MNFIPYFLCSFQTEDFPTFEVSPAGIDMLYRKNSTEGYYDVSPLKLGSSFILRFKSDV